MSGPLRRRNAKDPRMNRLPVAALLLVAYVSVAFRPCEGPRIAIVDMSALVSKHKASQAEQGLIQQWKDASEKLLDRMDKDYKEQAGARDQLKPDSDDYRKKTKELQLMKFKLDQEAAALRDEFEARVAKSLADSYARVAVACKSYLDSHDLDVVAQYLASPVRGSKVNEVMPDIMLRSIVAYRGTLDVTDGVLAILDAK
jgi:Skp family chaperone for outer membrane proteins